MEQIIKHYGNAILAAIVLLALGAILMAALAGNGYVAQAFQDAVSNFMDNMNGMVP